MAHILLLNDPNLSLLGLREPGLYGQVTLAQIHERTTQLAAEAGHRLSVCQSNSEAELIERIHQAPAGHVAFIIFNPAGFTHTNVVLRDALLRRHRIRRLSAEQVRELLCAKTLHVTAGLTDALVGQLQHAFASLELVQRQI